MVMNSDENMYMQRGSDGHVSKINGTYFQVMDLFYRPIPCLPDATVIILL